MEPEPTILKPTEVNDAIPTPPPTRSKPCLIAWFAIGSVLATWVCFLLIFAYFWNRNNDLQQNNAAISAQVQTQLSENQNHLTQVQAVIQKNFSSDTNLIRLKEIRELVQLANYNLSYLHDPQNALVILNLANKQLTELSPLTVTLEAAGHLLSQTIAKLIGLAPLNISDVLARLHSLQAQVTELPLLSTTPATKEISTPQTQEGTSDKTWIKAIQTSLHSFQQLIVIRHLDKPIEPLLPEIQQQYLQQNLQLLFQQAQWALLHNQQSIYQTSLQQAKDAIQRYFTEQSATTQRIVQQINALAEINLQVALPDLNPTLEALDAVIKTVASKPTDPKENAL